MTPTLLLTRPKGRNAAFADAVRGQWDGAFEVIASPLMTIAPVAASVPEVDMLIFTSANGVAAATAMGLTGLPAWCVGTRTAELAIAAGFAAQTGPGDANGLITDIISAYPSGSLAHIRGKHTRGDIAAQLNAAGLICQDVIAYNQLPCDLSQTAVSALNGEFPVILPLFSPRTAHILKNQGPFAAPLYIIGISEAVAEVVGSMPKAELRLAALPDAEMMAREVAAALRSLGTV